MASEVTPVSPSRSTRPTIAVIGGGQLARMLQEAASPLSINLRVLVESADGSAAQVNPQHIVGLPMEVSSQDLAALFEDAVALTFEHEHIPASIFEAAAGNVPARPSQQALLYAQDKLAMRRRLTELGVPAPHWREITAMEDLFACGEELGYPFIVKTPRGGYDGHGVLIVRSAHDIDQAIQAAEHDTRVKEILGGGTSAKGAGVAIVATWLNNGPLLAEEMVPFYDELSIQVARRPSGEMKTWPVVRSEQADGVCSIVTAPVPDLCAKDAETARLMALRVAEELDVTGVLAVELFRVRRYNADGTTTDDLLVNELAMRPHNTGHWSIEGANTSQFEQHLRAVADLPLGETTMNAPYAVMVNLLGSTLEDPAQALATAMSWAPSAKIHLYGKEVRPGRKLGHVTVCSDSADEARALAYAAMSALAGSAEPQTPPAPPTPPAA